MKIRSVSNKKFKVDRRSVCFKLNDIPYNVDDPEKWLKAGIRAIVEHIVQDVNPEDRVGFTFVSEDIDRGSLHLPIREAKNITFEEVLELSGKIYQSKSKGFHSDTFRMTMTHARTSHSKVHENK